MDSYGMNIIATKKILLDENIFGDFNRFDLVVRIMAIEEYYGEGVGGIKLYRKMQEKRIREIDFFNIEKGSDWEHFKKLIDKFEEKKYNCNYPIRFNRNTRLINGAHRVALSLYKNFPSMAYVYSNNIYEYNAECFYGIRWFEENNFSYKEINNIIKRYNILRKNCYEDIYAIVWSPAIGKINKIITWIKEILDYKVLEVKYKNFVSMKDFQKFVRKVYARDDISEKRLNNKIFDIIITGSILKIAIIKIRTNNILGIEYQNYLLYPDIRCEYIINLKKQIRKKLKSCIIQYSFDNTFHCGVTKNENLYLEEIYKEL